MRELPRDLHFPTHCSRRPPESASVCLEDTYQKTTMYSVSWICLPMNGSLQCLNGWHCYGCKTTFFVADPMTQLIHDCMKDRGFPSQS